jgi:cytochrome c biogenesis protein CcmG/thiol:disulfide interchange protein DsbE
MSTASSEGKKQRNILILLPLIVFLALAALFLYRLSTGDPSRIPSALIGHPAPATDLPPLPGLERDGKAVPGLNNATFQGAVTLVNVWASWCVPCHDEVPFLEKLSKDKRIQLVGINYKDASDNARRFLNRYGNPFVATGRDDAGRT